MATPTYHIVGKIPEDLLKLGSIIDDLKYPNPLNEGAELDLTQTKIYTDHETDFELTIKDMLKGSLGLSLKALGMEGVGGEAKVGGKRGTDDQYDAEVLDTEFFYPKEEHYAQAVKPEVVQKYLKAAKYGPVYLITGIKTVRRTTFTIKRENETEVIVKSQISIGGAGISIGPQADPSKTLEVTQKSKGTKSYIFAIQVTKLSYEKAWPWSEKTLKHERHVIGAQLVGIDEKKQAQDNSPKVLFNVAVLELDEELRNSLTETVKTKGGQPVVWAVQKQDMKS